eukprot:scaffold1193_cov159-Ochromonas_danica.AAC.6
MNGGNTGRLTSPYKQRRSWLTKHSGMPILTENITSMDCLKTEQPVKLLGVVVLRALLWAVLPEGSRAGAGSAVPLHHWAPYILPEIVEQIHPSSK